jgi:hypothetical protein
MRNLYILLLALSPLIAFSQLTGYWQSDLGGCYQITQNGNEVWWAGESPETMRAKNVFYGTVTGNTLNGVWCDLPSNTKQGFNERLSLMIEGSFKLVKTGETSPYLASTWTKLNGPCGSGTAQGNLYTNVAGTWYKNGEASMPCYITQDGANLSLTTDNNVSLGSFTSQKMIYASKWSTFGTISADGQTITWDNQTWTRQPTIATSSFPQIAGIWYKNGESTMPCYITQRGQNLSLNIDNNISKGSFTSPTQIYANAWATYGTLTSDGQTITWGNQTWTRQPKAVTGNYPNIAGTWYQNGNSNEPCTIIQNGQNLTLQVAGNVSQGSFSSQNQIYANTWNTYGNLSIDGKTITWGSQTWTRQAGTIGGGGNTGAVLEELSVPGTTSERTYTSNVLQQGKKYLLQISGTFSMWSTTEPEGVDALYAYREATPQLWSPLYIDDKPLVDYIKATGGSTEYHSDHIYQVTINGTGNRLSFYLNDGGYSDNCGSVTVRIMQQQSF